jgi:hypothetical protein
MVGPEPGLLGGCPSQPGPENLHRPTTTPLLQPHSQSRTQNHSYWGEGVEEAQSLLNIVESSLGC